MGLLRIVIFKKLIAWKWRYGVISKEQQQFQEAREANAHKMKLTEERLYSMPMTTKQRQESN